MVVVMKKVSEDYVKNAKIAKENYPGAVVMDVTLDGLMGKLDPGFQWKGGVEVPGRDKEKGLSLKGIWEGLKLFGKKDVDEKWWKDEKLIGKERNCKSYGKLRGVRIGEEELEMGKGKEVFENLYKDEIESRFGKLIDGLRKESEKREVVLLDYMEGDERKFLNHAEVLKDMIEEI